MTAEIAQTDKDHGLLEHVTLSDEEMEPAEADVSTEYAGIPLRIVTCYFLI